MVCIKNRETDSKSIYIERLECLLQTISVSIDDELLEWILKFTSCLASNFGHDPDLNSIFNSAATPRLFKLKDARFKRKGVKSSILRQPQILRSWHQEDLSDTSTQLYIQ